MKLEDMVTSLELSMRLKELNIPQKSLFFWCVCENLTDLVKEEDKDKYDYDYSSFTAGELGEMLPLMVQSYKSFKDQWECVYDPLELGFIDKNESNARARMLIHLIENRVIEV